MDIDILVRNGVVCGVRASNGKEGYLCVCLEELRLGRNRGTYARGVSAIALVAEGAFADDFAVDVNFIVALDVAGS